MSIQTTAGQADQKIPFLERAVDVDTHEMIPFHLWGEHFGEEIATKMAAAEHSPIFSGLGENSNVRPDVVGDIEEINYETTWMMKGCGAPGAIDLRRRVDVMDMQGVDKALMFPTFGLVGILMTSSPQFVRSVIQLPFDDAETRQLGYEVIDAYNDWAIRASADIDARLRAVTLITTDTVDGVISQARSLIERGVQAVWIPSGMPPAMTSPADPALDPFWTALADANVTALLHIGTDFSFANPLWANNVSAFVPFRTPEFVLSPFGGATTHTAAEYFLSALVLGGVFERIPNLRFGAVELGAQWLGPLAERLDIWADVFPKGLEGTLTKKPSEYLANNVRVAPFHFEAVDEFLERYPHLGDCYCYSSDYPHVEGGQDSKRVFADRLTRLGPDVMEKFFVSNGEWLLP